MPLRIDNLELDDVTGAEPVADGSVWYADNQVRVQQDGVVFGMGDIDPTVHDSLRTLAHFVDAGPAIGAYREQVGGLFPTEIIWWESDAKLKRVVDKVIDRTNKVFPPTVTWRAYETDGVTVAETLTETITYSGAAEVSRTRILS